MNVRDIILTAFALLVCVSCKKEKEMTLSGLNIRDFQTEVDGQLTDLYVLRNENGMEACITNYGGRVVSLMVPDRNGKMEDILRLPIIWQQNRISGRLSGGISAG